MESKNSCWVRFGQVAFWVQEPAKAFVTSDFLIGHTPHPALSPKGEGTKGKQVQPLGIQSNLAVPLQLGRSIRSFFLAQVLLVGPHFMPVGLPEKAKFKLECFGQSNALMWYQPPSIQ